MTVYALWFIQLQATYNIYLQASSECLETGKRLLIRRTANILILFSLRTQTEFKEHEKKKGIIIQTTIVSVTLLLNPIPGWYCWHYWRND